VNVRDRLELYNSKHNLERNKDATTANEVGNSKALRQNIPDVAGVKHKGKASFRFLICVRDALCHYYFGLACASCGLCDFELSYIREVYFSHRRTGR
jgi:hypothetical protein